MSFDPKIIGSNKPTPEPSAEDEALGAALAREAAMLASRYPADPARRRPQPAATGRGGLLPWVAALATCIALMTTAGIVWQNRSPVEESRPAVATPGENTSDQPGDALTPPVASATPVPPADALPASQAEAAARERLRELEAEIERQRDELERLKEDIRRVESRLEE